MRNSVIIVEDFYDDPNAVRNYALSQPYYFPYENDADVHAGRATLTWMASRFREANECPFKGSKLLLAALGRIIGEEIDRDHWNLSYPLASDGKAAPDCSDVPQSCLWNCCFHFKPDTGQRLGEGVHNHVTDVWNSVGENGWAGVLYLSPKAPLDGGVRLWRNRDVRQNLDWMTPRENWEIVDTFGNIYNRLLLCRGNIPHSGANGWGKTLEDGRLFQTFFFRVKKPRNEELNLSLKK